MRACRISCALLLKSEVLMSVGFVRADPSRRRIGVWSSDRTGCSSLSGTGLAVREAMWDLKLHNLVLLRR